MPSNKQKKNKTGKKAKKSRKNPPVPPRTVNGGYGPSMRKTTRTPPTLPKPQKMGIVEGVCSITDPFCVKARMSKWPDGNGGGTVPYQIRGLSTLTTDGGGRCIRFFGGCLPFNNIGYPNTPADGSGYASNVYTLPANLTQVSNATTFLAYADTYRITSWGIIIRNNLSATTSTGQVIVSKQNDLPAVSTTISEGGLFGSDVKTFPLCAGFECAIIAKTVGASARIFVANNTSTTEVKGWEAIKVEVQGGAASANVLSVEIVVNVEFTLAPVNMGMVQFARPDVPSAPHTVTAASKTLTNMSTIVEGGIERAGKMVINAAETAVEDIMSSGMAWLGL